MWLLHAIVAKVTFPIIFLFIYCLMFIFFKVPKSWIYLTMSCQLSVHSIVFQNNFYDRMWLVHSKLQYKETLCFILLLNICLFIIDVAAAC